ncbi:hypothetical protein ONE63_010401 [Megalurothrips usitatus]|uniref:Uncharacterized protein n=1 Tax=Megalurothrips usitatus TaxID=439358 RepID=A0AAV7XDS1_9NEOP|nr:hypothetical protein ONE63_010401 [Megalurothrips usitatus]
MALKQAREEFVKKIKSTSESHDKLQNQWHTLSEEKRSLLSELKDLSIKNEDLASALSEVSAQKTALANEKLSLLKEKVCWEEQLQETSQHLQDVKDKLAREDLEKKIVQDKLAEALAANDRLSSNLSIAAQQESDLTATLADMSRQKKAIENQLHSAQKERDQLQISLQETLSQLEGLTRAKENLNQDLGVKLEDVVQHITQIETLADQLKNITSHASKQQAEKEDAVNKLETAQNAMKDLEAKLESKCRLVEELTSALQTKDLLLTQSLASDVSRGELLSKQQIEKEDAVNKLETAQNAMKDLEAKLESKCKLVEELTSALQSKDLLLTQSQASDVSREELLSSCSEKMTSLMQEREKLSEELRNVQAEKQQTHTSLEQLRTEKSGKENDFLVAKAELTGQITYLQGEVEKSAAVRQNLEEKCEKTEEMLQQHKEMLVKSREDKEVLLAQIDELQSAVDVKEELLCDTQKCIEKLRAERDKLRDLLTVKDQIIITHKNTESSLERQSNDELEVAMKLLEGEVHSSHSTSEMMAQELRKAQQNFEAEKVKLEKALEEAQSTAKSFQQETVELKQQLTGPRAGGKLAALQQEEKIWKLDRMKNHLEFQFDSLMTQKIDVEDHLNQLREILKDVSCICDTLFASLPGSCDAVHEVTVMKKEVESKLRAVDKKYADSLCGIISLAHEMFVLRKKQTEDVLSDNVTNGSVVPSDKENIEIRVSKSCEAMTSLMCDVRSAINSCKFLIERCESYLKAQTRESLKIKMTIKEEIPDVASQSGESKLFQSSGSMGEKSVANFTDDFKNCSHDKSEWFGGSTTLEEGYNAMKKSHANLELRIAELSKQLKDLQTSVPEQVHNDMGSKMAKLQDRINVLMLRPTQEQLDDKLKELHNHYSNKLENMKTKMKQIVKDEVEKVEEEKIKSEKEIIAKYSKRISEFEEHVQQLSAQLWKLGEKLLQEQQDHKNAKENLAALKERQRQYLMSKQRTQSLDRLDRLGQGTKKTEPVAQLKRRCNSQIAQSSLVSTKVHPSMDDTFDIVDEGSSRRSTMMAPASMGLAFPEEDEDGEVFNNDYLAELKEGKCKVPSDGRLSELQYRNSLCPPHLKSSYPLETQFHDPQSLRDEEIKGPDRRLSRQGKDRGTTSYKKPGPPTPSKKAGRLSLQGKEDVTPRVAALREHNESVTSQGTGILRAGKTTPSRLRALFTSSKVANAATLPVLKKDENSAPATPTSKRLSIFKRRFGSSKENQSAATGYSSLH